MNIEETPLQKRRKLDEEIAKLRQLLEYAVRDRDQIEKDCNHKWSEPKYVPIRHEAYTIPGDPPGTMGVDRQLPCHVPAKTEDWWERICENCGKLQRTDRTKDKIDKIPQF